MRTTLDLPNDVALFLRRESASRGGRRAAPVSGLIADAVRGYYMKPKARPKIDLTPGRVLIKFPNGTPKITHEEVRDALDEMGC